MKNCIDLNLGEVLGIFTFLHSPLVVCPPKFCINTVFNFSWDGYNTQEKWKTKVMQNLGGQTRCIMGDVQMVNFPDSGLYLLHGFDFIFDSVTLKTSNWTVLRDEFWPLLLCNLVIVHRRSDSASRDHAIPWCNSTQSHVQRSSHPFGSRHVSSFRDAQWICAATKVARFDFLTFSDINLAISVNLNGFSAWVRYSQRILQGLLQKRGERGVKKFHSAINLVLQNNNNTGVKKVSSHVTKNTTILTQ